jgi:hypothetical protein
LIVQKGNVEDRHRLDAGLVLESDRTFHSDANRDPDHTPSFTHLGKYEEKKIVFINSSASLHCFTCLVSVIDVKCFDILDSKLKLSRKNYI